MHFHLLKNITKSNFYSHKKLVYRHNWIPRFKQFHLTFLGTEEACKWAINPNQYAFDLISASCLIRRVRLAYNEQETPKDIQEFKDQLTLKDLAGGYAFKVLLVWLIPKRHMLMLKRNVRTTQTNSMTNPV